MSNIDKLFTNYLFKKTPLLVLAYLAGRGDEDRTQAAIVAVYETLAKVKNGVVPTKNGKGMHPAVAVAFAVHAAVSKRNEVFSKLVDFSDLTSTDDTGEEVEAIYELVSDGLSLEEIVALESGHPEAWFKALDLGICAKSTVGAMWPLMSKFIQNTVFADEHGLVAVERDEAKCKAYEIRESDRFKAARANDPARLGYGPEDGEDADEEWLMADVEDDHDRRVMPWEEKQNQEDPDAEIDESLDIAMMEDDDPLDEAMEEHEREFFWGYQAAYPLPSKQAMRETWANIKLSVYVRTKAQAILSGLGPVEATAKAMEQVAIEKRNPFLVPVTNIARGQGKLYLVTMTGVHIEVGRKVLPYADKVKVAEGKSLKALAEKLTAIGSAEVVEFASRMTREA